MFISAYRTTPFLPSNIPPSILILPFSADWEANYTKVCRLLLATATSINLRPAAAACCLLACYTRASQL